MHMDRYDEDLSVYPKHRSSVLRRLAIVEMRRTHYWASFKALALASTLDPVGCLRAVSKHRRMVANLLGNAMRIR